MIDIKKSFVLDNEYLQKHKNQTNNVIKSLNALLNEKVHFSICDDKLFVLVLEENLKSKAGRPTGHDFDYCKVEQMKADGKTNKQIYTELGISKSLYYLRMREYKK